MVSRAEVIVHENTPDSPYFQTHIDPYPKVIVQIYQEWKDSEKILPAMAVATGISLTKTMNDEFTEQKA
jgi:hypothetical protein